MTTDASTASGQAATREGVRRLARIVEDPSPMFAAETFTVRPRLLIVDDDRSVRAALTRLLSRWFDVTACAHGGEALERLAFGDRFDVILSDNDMPEVSGIDLYGVLERALPEQAARFAFLAATPVGPSSVAASRPFFMKPMGLAALGASLGGLLAEWGAPHAVSPPHLNVLRR